MREQPAESFANSTDGGHGLRRSYGKVWGSEFVGADGARFRIWAPAVDTMTLVLGDRRLPLLPAGDGWLERTVDDIRPDIAYHFELEDGTSIPDPASRAQIGGIGGPSRLVDPRAFRWTDGAWRGRAWEEAVIYELHVGTFTPEGTFAAARRRLSRLAALGFTAIELMPVSQFLGNHGWGYDGVLPYSPHHAYGTPDDMKAFVDAAHGLGLMVVLDVVYNHFGPRGNFLPLYAPTFFHADRDTGWGQAIDFTPAPVRSFFVDNALYWLIEYNLDGLRLDAVHAMEDGASPVHILAELSESVGRACTDRKRHLTIEEGRNCTYFIAPGSAPDGGSAYDAAWNDDLHHALHVAATGEDNGHFANYHDDVWRKLAQTLASGFIFRKEPLATGGRQGPDAGSLSPTAFIGFLQNHDQIGNRAFGDRLAASVDPALLRVLTAILVLSPQIPMVFQGDDYGEKRPFHFFLDCDERLACDVRNGRFQEVNKCGGLPDDVKPEDLSDPASLATFLDSKLDWSESASEDGRRHAAWLGRIIARRRETIVPHLHGARAGRIEDVAPGCVAVDWPLEGARLSLRANLSSEPQPLPAATGRLVHAEPETAGFDDEGRLPPLSALFFLDASSPGDD